jgi:hypothetical protein
LQCGFVACDRLAWVRDINLPEPEEVPIKAMATNLRATAN